VASICLRWISAFAGLTSYPRPLWFDLSLNGRSFKSALGESLFREQYIDAVGAIINAQEAAALMEACLVDLLFAA
jgi:hypothetical protein